jgi:glycosyltransferase involved in cell wall biosynthesis
LVFYFCKYDKAQANFIGSKRSYEKETLLGTIMNILILSPFFRPNVGGVETHIDDLCKYFSVDNEIFVVTYQPLTINVKGSNIEVHKNLEIFRLPWFRGTLFFDFEKYPILEFLYLTPALFMFSFQFMLRRQKQIDVIHAHGLNAAFIAKFIGKFFNKKVVTTVHAVYSAGSVMSNLFKWTFISSDVILALSEKSKQELMKLGIPETKIKISRQWVDQNKFKLCNRNHLKMKKEKQLNQKFVILFVGRLIEAKGVKILLEVASRMSENMNVAFFFLGSGPLDAAIKKAASTNPNVKFLGKVNDDDLVNYYNAADILAVPSTQNEGAPRVVMEALSCGLPVLASNKGCLPDMLDSSVGWIIEPTAKDFFEKISQILNNPTQLYTRALKCRKYAETLFSIKNVDVIQKSYRAVV